MKGINASVNLSFPVVFKSQHRSAISITENFISLTREYVLADAQFETLADEADGTFGCFHSLDGEILI
jgi:hypothetical protein